MAGPHLTFWDAWYLGAALRGGGGGGKTWLVVAATMHGSGPWSRFIVFVCMDPLTNAGGAKLYLQVPLTGHPMEPRL